MQEVKSSTITHVGHNPESKELRVRFAHGGEYLYPNVTGEEYLAFVGAKSIGQHFHAHIRPKEGRKVQSSQGGKSS